MYANRKGTVGGLLILFVVLGPIFYWMTRPPEAELEVATPAPALDGEDFKLDDVSADLVLVAFWQSTERNCEAMMPLLTRLEAEYEPERFALVAVNIDDPEGREAAVKSFFHGRKRPNNLVLAGKEPVASWKLTKVPTLYLLGADRRILAGHVGQVSEETLRQDIGAALGALSQ